MVLMFFRTPQADSGFEGVTGVANVARRLALYSNMVRQKQCTAPAPFIMIPSSSPIPQMSKGVY
jgi:hypothetical protein